MKTSLKTLLLLIVVPFFSRAQYIETSEMKISGYYTGKNIFVKNSFMTDYGFGITEVKVNDIISTAEINATLFEIALDQKSIPCKIGELIQIKIKYRKNAPYMPAIMNPGVLFSEENKKNPIENHLKIEGQFNPTTLYVINPLCVNKKSRALKEIKINGKTINANLQSEVVSIDLSSLNKEIIAADGTTAINDNGLKIGEIFTLEFIYHKDTDIMILNPEEIALPVKN